MVDRQNRRIQVFGPDGGFVRKWSPSTEGGLWCAIAVDAANFTYLPSQTDTLHGYVNKFDVLGNRQALFAGPGDLSNPYEAAADLDGNIYALDGAGRILKLSPAGDHLLTIGSPGSGPGELRSPQGLPIDTLRGVLYVADTSNNRVQRFSVDGRHLGGWGTQGSDNGQFDRPTDVAVTPRRRRLGRGLQQPPHPEVQPQRHVPREVGHRGHGRRAVPEARGGHGRP